jgi:hypothetical protein
MGKNCVMKSPDIQEARNEFERAESEPDPTAKLDALEEGLALVEEVLAESGIAEPEKGIARNVRRTYLRRLIQQLVRMPNVQFSDWFGYMRLLLVDQRDVVNEILAADAVLNAAYQVFSSQWSRQFSEALGQDIEAFVRGEKA